MFSISLITFFYNNFPQINKTWLLTESFTKVNDYLWINNLFTLFYTDCYNFNYTKILISNIDNMKTNHFYFLTTEVFLATTLSYLLIYALFKRKKLKKTLFVDISVSVFFVHLYSIIFLLNNISMKSSFLFNNMFLSDFFNLILKIVVLVISLIVLVFINTTWFINLNFLNHNKYEYPIFILYTTFSALILISAYDLMLFYISLEMLSFCLYILIILNLKNKLATEAAIKYFCLGALASSFLIFGVCLIYGNLGSINFYNLKNLLNIYNYDNSNFNLYVFGLIFILIGFLFKMSLFPYHMGLIDVYEGSSLTITLYLLSVIKLTIVLLFTKFLFQIFYNLQIYWSPIIAFSAISSMFLGSIAALHQKKIKRFFAYSSLHQMGYILLGISFGGYEGLFSTVLYMLVYVITTVLFFGVLLIGFSKNKTKTFNIFYLSNLSKFYKKYFFLSTLLIISLLSLANLPPLAGFFAKMYIFKSAINSSYIYIWLLAFIGIITSLFSTFYYLRIIKLMVFESETINLEKLILFKNKLELGFLYQPKKFKTKYNSKFFFKVSPITHLSFLDIIPITVLVLLGLTLVLFLFLPKVLSFVTFWTMSCFSEHSFLEFLSCRLLNIIY